VQGEVKRASRIAAHAWRNHIVAMTYQIEFNDEAWWVVVNRYNTIGPFLDYAEARAWLQSFRGNWGDDRRSGRYPKLVASSAA
jgi:hypothetical protein